MSVYIPPSIRTVREEVQGAVVITGGEVIPAFIGQSFGKDAPVGGYEAIMGAAALYTFPDLDGAGPVDAVIQVRSKLTGGIAYRPGDDYVFDKVAQTINWAVSSPLAAPYLVTVAEEDGVSTLVSGNTYYYVVTAIKKTNLNGPVWGETIASNELSKQVSATSKRLHLTWAAVNGAEGYKIYRSMNSGDYTGSALLVTITGGFNNEYVDNGTATGAGSPPGLPTHGQVAAGSAGPYNLEPSQTLIIKVNAGPDQTVTFTAARASRTATAPMAFPADVPSLGDTLSVRIDGGDPQVVTFAGSESDLLSVLAAINGVLTGGSAIDDGSGAVKLQSDKRGTGSSVEVVGGTSLAKLHLTVGTTAGTGNVANIDAVSVSEVAAVILAGTSGTTTGVNGSNRPFVQTSTAGSGGSIQVTGGTANTAIAFSTSVVTGSDATVATALRRPAVNTGAGTGEHFFVDYTYKTYSNFLVQRFTNLGLAISEYGLGSNLAIAATLAMAGSGRGNNASIILAMSVPDDTLPTYQTALDFLARRKDVSLVVPCSVVDGINNAVKQHCLDLSSTDKKRERIGVVGTPIGTKIGDEDTAGTVVYLARQLDTRRMILVHPWPVCSIQTEKGNIQDTELDGWASAAVLAGRICSLPDRAESPTSKEVQGIKRLGVELEDTDENIAGAAGACILTEENGNIIVRDGVTTTLDNEADMQISINLTDDLLRNTLRVQFRNFRGRKLLPNLLTQIQTKTKKLLQSFVKMTLIAGFDPDTISAVQDPDRLTWVIVRFTYQPIFPVRVVEFRYSFDLRAAALAA